MINAYATDTTEPRKCMIDSGYTTISELAESAGVNRNTLGKVLRGNIQPSAEVMYKLASTLQMSPEKAGMTFLPATYIARK